MKLKRFVFIVICLSLVTTVFSQEIKKSKKDKNKKNKVEKVENQTINGELPSAVTQIIREPGAETPKPVETPTPKNIEKTPIADTESFRYKIGLLDYIQIDVYRHPELSGTFSVSEQGTIKIPRLTKSIAVVCKTETQVAEEIKNDLKSFLREPYVTARVTQQNSQPFAVIGAVEKPGNFALNRSVSLLELIAMAGGPDSEKAGTKVQVARLGGVSGCEQNDNTANSDDKFTDSLFAYYKLKDVFENRNNPRMRPGDIVRVLEFEELYVVGNVEKPQVIKFKDNMTVSEAIAASGGFASASKKNSVIIRRKENGNAVDIVVDIEKVEKKQARDVQLLPEDIVFVPNDKVKGTLNDIRKAFTQGLPSILRPF
ncbi:MAG: polysaccharide export protein [Pyrinomonadaceae bacterium]|nr:polysaccharide export protein [Pyrinomonadaceae bacterium]